MDLETENRIASILLKEAAELRRQAEREGVHAYLRQPHVRGRPNSRFLTATVLGVQQANRVVEVNEMWRVRQKEKELDDRIKGRLKGESSERRSQRETSDSSRSPSRRHFHNDKSASAPCSSGEVAVQGPSREDDEGLRDEEVETFLNSRVKRGRGAIGSRMDETGPYLPSGPDSKGKVHDRDADLRVREERGNRVILGPEKPLAFETSESSEDESSHTRRKKSRKVSSSSSSKQHSRRHSRSKEKEKSRDKKKRHKEGKRCKYYK